MSDSTSTLPDLPKIDTLFEDYFYLNHRNITIIKLVPGALARFKLGNTNIIAPEFPMAVDTELPTENLNYDMLVQKIYEKIISGKAAAAILALSHTIFMSHRGWGFIENSVNKRQYFNYISLTSAKVEISNVVSADSLHFMSKII